MARLPTVGLDNGNWGTLLNEYLSVQHNADGSHNLDASNITYSPTDNTKWSGSSDPGNINSSLDQLANRLKAVESIGVYPPNSPDAPPENPHQMDDEFNDGVIDPKWITYTDSGVNAVYTEENGYLNLSYSGTGTNTKRFVAKLQEISGSSWRFRTKMYLNSGSNNYQAMGMIIRNSANDKTAVLWFISHESYGSGLTGLYTRYNGQTWVGETDLPNIYSQMIYAETEYDGTNLIFKISSDGFNYSQFFSVTTASWLGGTPDYVGIGLHPYNDIAGNIPLVSIDWFRRIS